MSSRHYPATPLLGACVAIWRADTILLAKRSRAPSAGLWAMPGGLVEIGETLEQAAKREVFEETALEIDEFASNRFHEIIRRDKDGAVEVHYVLAMFVAVSKSGNPVAGDDAADVAWFASADLDPSMLVAHTTSFVDESRKFLHKLK